MTFEFLKPAQDEFEEACDWYLARSVATEEGFRNRVVQAIEAAMLRPTSAGFLVSKRVRKILLDPYDYGLLYFVHEQVLYVVAISHNRRRPGYWRRRLTRT